MKLIVGDDDVTPDDSENERRGIMKTFHQRLLRSAASGGAVFCFVWLLGCRAQTRDEFHSHIDWRQVDYQVKNECRREKGEEFDELIEWVVEEVNGRVEAGDLIIAEGQTSDLGPLKEDIVSKYQEERGEKFDDLVIWIVNEVDRQIKSGKCIVNPKHPNLSDVMFLEKPTIKREP